MDGFGTMREKLDIKILILFILRRLPEEIDSDTLANLVLEDGTVGYFEYAECLGELVDTDHVEKLIGCYKATEKGCRNGEIVESSLPYTVRMRLEKKMAPIIEAMRRRAMIQTGHENRDDGCRVDFAMSDGYGNIIELRLLCGGEDQAKRMEENFRNNAESYYQRIVEMLCE